jgi:hypothetical protein
MRAVINAYHAACAAIMPIYDGFITEFRGDGIMAYFGYPRAHEDDAERAVRAGLDIISALTRLETRAAEPLAVRVGIATGLVVGPGRSSSPPPRADCSAICSICATSVAIRSRAFESQSRLGQSKVHPNPRAVSKQSARHIEPDWLGAKMRSVFWWNANASPGGAKARSC